MSADNALNIDLNNALKAMAPPARKGRTGYKDKKPRKTRPDAATMSKYLGRYHCRGPEHGWPASMTAARLALPTCSGVTSKGLPCTQPRIGGHAYCRHHAPRDVMTQYDARARVHAQDFIIDRLASPSVVIRALTRVVAIERRILKRQWAGGRRDAPGATLILSAPDERTLRRALRDVAGVDLDGEHSVLTPAGVDHVRWMAFDHLRGYTSPELFARRVSREIKADERWRARGLDDAQP